MPNCKVKGCLVGSGSYKGPKIQLLPFPKIEATLSEWKKRLGLPDLETDLNNFHVCAKHFVEEAFIPDEENVDSRGRKRGKRQLKPLAYPTLFLEQRKVRNSDDPDPNFFYAKEQS